MLAIVMAASEPTIEDTSNLMSGPYHPPLVLWFPIGCAKVTRVRTDTE